MHRFLRSRLAVVLVFGVTLLALDVGRSIWARVALALPSAEYRPDPALYADPTWPPGAHLNRDMPLGPRTIHGGRPVGWRRRIPIPLVAYNRRHIRNSRNRRPTRLSRTTRALCGRADSRSG
jgi:hypothetical protein